MMIRKEQPSDVAAIDTLTERAFAPMAFSSGTEATIIKALRQTGRLALSLVAEEEGTVVGHVAFSSVTIGETMEEGWFGLGPISVEPIRQRVGIGRALVQTGLDALRQAGAKGVVLIGNPTIYSRYGFESDGRLTYGSLATRLVQRIVFTGAPPVGELHFADAFEQK
ncbi:GNAT family N-acetyltransferase [Allorhizobium taibaishanense]|uniref:GNAT family N-acetyltransferase n=2 Tax=Allorhizobium taibaishanense TaxID=887144 RepID=A0A1Q9A5K2_9HYPH|nr:N-acetyltransferase [Allorhizobium taibaishanense]OLP49829.1 GNAT family N-acetyltransferase [Allorhizobium taibaishanense]